MPARPSNAAIFKNLMNTAKFIAELHPNALHDLINAILRPEQSELMLRGAEYGTEQRVDVSGPNFFGPHLHHFLPEYENNRQILKPEDNKLRLGRDMIFACTSNDGKFTDALSYVGSSKATPPSLSIYKQGSWQQDGNHTVSLWLPWRIAFVNEGNHSLTAGILAAEGLLTPRDVADYSHIFKDIVCDGNEFLQTKTGETFPVKNVRRAAVFEIGRMIANQKKS